MRKLIEEAHEGNDIMGSATYSALSIDFDRVNGCYLGGKIIGNFQIVDSWLLDSIPVSEVHRLWSSTSTANSNMALISPSNSLLRKFPLISLNMLFV